tara:strand:- start:58094 stop:58252 length:159 start_codon:yes stop_codon:yes gene_type:complete
MEKVVLSNEHWQQLVEEYKVEQAEFKRIQEEQRQEIEQLKEQIKLLTKIIKS